jgi:serine/threonine-protein kinase
VVRAIGAGAGSTIFLVHETETGRPFALKVVKRHGSEDDIYLDQAVHEHEVLRMLEHPSIVKVYDCRLKKNWFKTTSVELLLEYIEGRTLDDLEVRKVDQLVLIFIHVASALNHMHMRGVFHGDLKPGNIMLSRLGQVKVIDFGTAWLRGHPKGRIQGTVQYMAPEQATDKIVDEMTDLYNLGATMYRMFTGHHVNLSVGSGGAGLDLGFRSRPRSPQSMVAELPGSLSALIMRCIDPVRENRPSSSAELKRELVKLARALGLSPEDLRGSEDGVGDGPDLCGLDEE